MSSSLTSELSWQLEQSEASWAAAGDEWNDESAPPYLDMVNSSAGQQLMMAAVLDAFPAASGAFAAESAAAGAPYPQPLETLAVFLQLTDSVPEPIAATVNESSDTPSAAAIRAPPGLEHIAATLNGPSGTVSAAAPGAPPGLDLTSPPSVTTTYYADRRVLPEEIPATVNEPSGAPSAAAAGAPSSALELAIQKRLREVKEPHITWHTVLNSHASKRPRKYGGPLCASVTACKAFTRVGEAHSCRIVLPNSYAPDDGKVVDVEASAPDKATAEADAGCAAFARLCADRDGLENVIFRPCHWTVPTETLINDIGFMLGAADTIQPLGVHRRRAAASGARVEGALQNVPDENLQRAAALIRLCLRAYDGSFAPSKLALDQAKVYAQLEALLPVAHLRQFIEQHPEFDIDETGGPWRIKWRSAAPQRPPPGVCAAAAVAPVTSAAPSASAASGAPSSAPAPQRPSGRAPVASASAASGAPSASASSGTPGIARTFRPCD